jgi:uncharacterized protein HemX
VPSASSHRSRFRQPLARAAAVAACLMLIGVGAAGCETTQEKAAKQQAQSAHILKERDKRQKARKARKNGKKHHQKGKEGKSE